MEKIFITGIAGFLGSHLAERFSSLGYKVSGNDTLIGGYRSNIPNEVEFFQTDCNDLTAMTEHMKDSDIVIHCAAAAYEGLSVFSPSYIVENTLQASVNVVTAAIRNKVKRIVYCSSMARYGENSVPFTEDMLPRPRDPYGIAKVAGEEILKSLCEVNDIEWNIVVPHNIIGPRQKYDDPYRNVISIMLNRCLQNLPPIVYGDGSQKRCFSYIDDCIFCIQKIALDPSLKYLTINIGPDREFVTINQVAKMVMKITNFDGDIKYYSARPLEVQHANCSADLATKLFGYQQQTLLEYGIQKTKDWIAKQGTKPFQYHLPVEIINDKTPITWIKNSLNE
jgi:UDP-glucose 4-epimerase